MTAEPLEPVELPVEEFARRLQLVASAPALHAVSITANAAGCPVCGWLKRRVDVEREQGRPLDDVTWEGTAAGLASVHLIRMGGHVITAPDGSPVVPLQSRR